MRHQMKLSSNDFLRMKTGEKTLEYRLYDEKRRNIKIGDEIEFLKLPYLDETILKKVEKLYIYKSWVECYRKFFKEDLSKFYKTVGEVVENTYDKFYSPKEEEEYGCVAIRIKSPN